MKFSIEIFPPFMYNVTNAVFDHAQAKEAPPPERSSHNYVHSQRDP